MHISQISKRNQVCKLCPSHVEQDPACDHRFPTSSGPSGRKVSEVGGAVMKSRTIADDPIHPLDREDDRNRSVWRSARESTSAGSGDLGYLGCIILTWH